jgi:hypothetical protein
MKAVEDDIKDFQKNVEKIGKEEQEDPYEAVYDENSKTFDH